MRQRVELMSFVEVVDTLQDAYASTRWRLRGNVGIRSRVCEKIVQTLEIAEHGLVESLWERNSPGWGPVPKFCNVELMQEALKAVQVGASTCCKAKMHGGEVLLEEGSKSSGNTIQMQVNLERSSCNQCLAQAGECLIRVSIERSQWLRTTRSVLWTDGQAFVHSDAVSERIDPDIPQLIMLGIIETRQCVVCAFHQVPIALVLGILQEVAMIVDVSRPEKLHSFKEIDVCSAHLTTNERFAENECEEVSSRQVPVERRGMFRSRDIEFDE
jgi:hypothetical protein